MAARTTKTVGPTVLTFTKERETKGTWRYKEDAAAADAVVGTLYLKKAAVEALGSPEALQVTIEAV